MTQSILSAAGLVLAGLFATAAPGLAQGTGSATMDSIKSKGQLACGVSTGIAGFSLANSKGVTHPFRSDAARRSDMMAPSVPISSRPPF